MGAKAVKFGCNHLSMRKCLLFLFTVLLVGTSRAQTAVVKDADGYCSIRQSADIGSKIIDTLHIERLVYILPDQENSEWYQVDYIKSNRKPLDQICSGFIHRSRVVLLSSFGRFSRVEETASKLLLSLDSLHFEIAFRPFSRKVRKIEYGISEGEERYVKSIDGTFPWGIDGNIPRQEYEFVKIIAGKRTNRLAPKFIGDLFEPNLSMTSAYYDPASGRCYLEALNSDGAGAYMVVWVFEHGELVSRETFIPF
ncbi:MAG: hypothetical protein WBP58_14530 [Chitinophagaceae bacterium]